MSHRIHLFRRDGFSLWNTLWINWRVFPFAVARRLPLKVGRRVDVRGLRRGCVRLREGLEPHRYMVRLGYSPWPLYSNRSMRTWLWFHHGAVLTVGDDADFNSGCRLVITAQASLEVGDRFFVNQNSLIYCSRSIRFGDDCTLGWDCQVYDSDFHICRDMKTGEACNPVAPVMVSDNVWLANRVTVGKGSVIPSGSVVASGSLVNGDLNAQVEAAGRGDDPGYLFAGTPARLKDKHLERITDKRQEAKLRRRFLKKG